MKLNTKPLADVQAGKPLVADGVYYAQLKADQPKKSASTGSTYVPLVARILDPEVMLHNGSQYENNGRIYAYGVLSLTPTDNYDPDERCREIIDSLAESPDSDLTLEMLDGSRICKIKTKFKPSETYTANGVQKQSPEKVEIANFVPMTLEELESLDFDFAPM